jgi:hypothetical protein
MELPPGMVWIHVVLAALTWLALLWTWVAVPYANAPRELSLTPAEADAPSLVTSRS